MIVCLGVKQCLPLSKQLARILLKTPPPSSPFRKTFKLSFRKNHMQLRKKLLYAGIFTIAVLVTSLFFKIVPCRVAPSAPPYSYTWAFCSLNPTLLTGLTIKEFFGYTTTLKDASIIFAVIAFIFAMLFFHLFTRKKH